MNRLLLAGLLSAAAVGTQARPTTMYVGAPHTPSITFGPADMLCDLNTCRLFNLPSDLGLPPGSIVEFALPQLNGQDRVDIRRCLQVCRAAVIGYESQQKTPPDHGNPTIAIIPIEMRLE